MVWANIWAILTHHTYVGKIIDLLNDVLIIFMHYYYIEVFE
jgi:hypothetical protein